MLLPSTVPVKLTTDSYAVVHTLKLIVMATAVVYNILDVTHYTLDRGAGFMAQKSMHQLHHGG